MKIRLLLLVLGIFFYLSCSSQDENALIQTSTQKITNNEGLNNAFTDLIFFDNQWFISYRESDKHALGKDGIVKIMSSPDGKNWTLVKIYAIDNLDLRNAMFAIKDDNLMAYIHGSRYIEKKIVMFNDFKVDYVKGKGWNDLQSVHLEKRKGYVSQIEGNQAWPWKIMWYQGKAYSFAYGTNSFGANGFFDLYVSSNGLDFKNMFFDQTITGYPTEATLEVDASGVFYVVLRRDADTAIVGKSINFGRTLEWIGEIPIYNFGGPDFVFYKGGLLVSGREKDKVILGYYDLQTNEYKKLHTLKSGGDCSYPGMVVKDNFLWISYYSGHENKIGTSIYVSQIDLNKFSY